MNLTPELVADILVRQGFLKPEQGEAVKQEARALPRSMRNANAFEQRAVAYELVLQMRLPNQRDSGAALGEGDPPPPPPADPSPDPVPTHPLTLTAALIEAKLSGPSPRRHRMIPLDMASGKL